MYANWFNRCIGKWTSHRRYLMGPKRSIDNLVTDFEIVERPFDEETGFDNWAVLWQSDRNEGEMGIVLNENAGEVYRSRNYFDNGEGSVTKLERVDEDTVVFYSAYGGMEYREEIRFLQNDKYRLRQTVGYKEGTDIAIVIGQYWEERV